MPQTRARRYLPRPDRPVAAVQLAFDKDGFDFTYRKWGGRQRAKAGDWLVNNAGEVYTVDADVFARTYRSVDAGPGRYVKTTPIWAERAETAGSVPTKEGATQYDAGDYLVSNSEDGSDRYAITAAKFGELYVAAEGDDSSS
jgi:hypothetical protein